jgi:hypothetical protein
LPSLFLLHRRWGVEGDFHHGESSCSAVRRGSNQRPGLQVERGVDSVCPSNTYFLSFCLMLLQAQVWGYLWRSPKLDGRPWAGAGRCRRRSGRGLKCWSGGDWDWGVASGKNGAGRGGGGVQPVASSG